MKRSGSVVSISCSNSISSAKTSAGLTSRKRRVVGPLACFQSFTATGPETRPELIGLERGKLAEGVHSPFVQDGDDVRNLCGPSRCSAGFFVSRSLHSRTLLEEEYVQ